MTTRTTLTKFFRFSASYEENGKIHGHNYRLGATVEAAPGAEEALQATVTERLIRPMESRDLKLHVDFLKGVAISDETLLDIFWKRLTAGPGKLHLRELSLERDEKTRFAKVEDGRL